VVQLVNFVVGRIKNFFSKEIVVILTNVRTTGEVTLPDNMVSSEENFQITEINSVKSRRRNGCTAFWKNSFEDIFGKQIENGESREKAF
jgi:hypothetical protein